MNARLVCAAVASLLVVQISCAPSRAGPDAARVRPAGEPEVIDLRANATRIEAVSLLGRPLFPPTLNDETQRRLEADLAAAQDDFREDPTDESNIIWYGRRLAYLGRYTDALGVYTQGLLQHPDSFRIRRHAGHRLITLRRFEDAIADLSRAAELIRDLPDEVEPDGMPNAFNIPRSTTHTNIWYHLGLAHYLTGDLERALAAYRECLKIAPNDDMLVATSHWLYMTLRRLGRDDEAQDVLGPIHDEMEILENDAYYALLLMYKGERSAPSVLAESRDNDLNFATVAYGEGNWHRVEGDEAAALAVFREIVEGSNWAAFGHIAAEADLARAQ